jgi:hypothetical protein
MTFPNTQFELRILKCHSFTGGLMKVHFAVALLGSALGTALPAFADEVPSAASSTQDAIPVDSDGPTGHPAIKDHHPKRPKKQHPNTPEEASGKSAPSSVSEAKQDPPASGDTNDSNNAANSPTEPRLTFQYWNYYAPILHDNSNWAENEAIRRRLMGEGLLRRVLVDSLREGGAREILKSKNAMASTDYLATLAKYALIGIV